MPLTTADVEALLDKGQSVWWLPSQGIYWSEPDARIEAAVISTHKDAIQVSRIVPLAIPS